MDISAALVRLPPEEALVGLEPFPPEIFTESSVAGGVCPLVSACIASAEVPLWMLKQGAKPSSRQCSHCLAVLVIFSRPEWGRAACAALAKELLRRGADANFSRSGGWPMVFRQAWWTGALRVVLKCPDVELTKETEELAAEYCPNAVELVREARVRLGRWGEPRRAWVAAVIAAAGARQLLTK